MAKYKFTGFGGVSLGDEINDIFVTAHEFGTREFEKDLKSFLKTQFYPWQIGEIFIHPDEVHFGIFYQGSSSGLCYGIETV